MTRIFVCFDCGGEPCVLRCPENGDFLPTACPFYETEAGVVRPPWHEAQPVVPK